MTKQSFYDKIKALGANDETTVNFSWEEGCDVFHYNETHVETAMSEKREAFFMTRATPLLKRCAKMACLMTTSEEMKLLLISSQR
jgi:hypothetical protein